jgi:hypothetical protein
MEMPIIPLILLQYAGDTNIWFAIFRVITGQQMGMDESPRIPVKHVGMT